jgi:Rod binding domain-containing protein
MVSDIGGASANAFSQLTEAKYSSVSKQVGQLSGNSGEQKIQHSASEFESILLTSWLESAEKSFATVPGGDDDENADPGKNQFQSYAMQAVATSLTKAGGIGIAAMIASSLGKISGTEQSPDSAEETEKVEGRGLSTVKEKM